MGDWHLYAAGSGGEPQIRKVRPADIVESLRAGVEDFWAMPTHLAALGVIYPLAGALVVALASFADLLHLVFPLASGFALIGPVFAIFLYGMSRRRERDLPPDWTHAFDVLRSPSLPAIAVLSVALSFAFAAWVGAAHELYAALFEDQPPATLGALLGEVIGTERGHWLFVAGGAIGFVFAVAVFAVSVVSFPLLLDRDVGLRIALKTSLAAVAASPLTMALWAFIIAAALVIASAPLFLGLVFVVPVLGHASWHFYRSAVRRDSAHENPVEYPAWIVGRPARFHAGAHSFLFPIGPKEE